MIGAETRSETHQWAYLQPLFPGQDPESVREAVPLLWAAEARAAGFTPAGECTVSLLESAVPVTYTDPESGQTWTGTERAWRAEGPVTQ